MILHFTGLWSSYVFPMYTRQKKDKGEDTDIKQRDTELTLHYILGGGCSKTCGYAQIEYFIKVFISTNEHLIEIQSVCLRLNTPTSYRSHGLVYVTFD